MSDLPNASRILVTGADGFIGQTLCPVLERAGHRVRKAIWLPLPSADQDWFVSGDIGPDTDWSEALTGIDTVIHLAGRAHILKETAPDPLAEFRRVNVEGTRRLAQMAANSGVKRLVFISSIGVNGSSTPYDQPFTEESPAAPHNPYARSKWEAEQALQSIAQKTGLEIVIVRPPLVYGPGVKANFLQLLTWVQRGIPLPLGYVRNRRSLIGVQNLADFLRCAAEHPAAANQVFLVSDGDDLSTTELIRRMARALNRPARLVPVPAQLVNLPARMLGKEKLIEQLWGSLAVNMQKAHDLLRWTPPLSVDEGLKHTAAWLLHQS
jgi:UDP-4-keto-D-QuiNAc 4-reductase